MRLFRYLRYRFHYYQLMKNLGKNGKWQINEKMLKQLSECFKQIPNEFFFSLTRQELQSLEVHSYYRFFSEWERAMDDAIDIIQSGGDFSYQYQRYGELDFVDMFTYHHQVEMSLIKRQFERALSKLTTVVSLLDACPDHQYTYYLRIVRKLIVEGVDLLTTFNSYYKENST